MSNLYEMWTGAQANGAARVKQSQLAGLVSPALGGDKAAQTRMIGLDPEMGMKVQQYAGQQAKSQQDAQQAAHKELGSLAAGVVQAAQGGDQARLHGSYQALVQKARQIDPNAPISDDYDPADLPHIHKLIALGGGGEQQEQFTLSPGSARYGADGKLIVEQPFAPVKPDYQLVEGADGYSWVPKPTGAPQGAPVAGPSGGAAGLMDSAFNGASVNPVQDFQSLLGGFPGTQVSSLARSPGRNNKVGGVPNSYHLKGQAGDFVVPQAQRQEFIAKARSMGYDAIDEGDHVHVEPRRGAKASSSFAAGQGINAIPIGGVRPKAKDDKPSDLERKLEIARGMGATDAELKQMVIGKEGAAAGAKPMPVGALKEDIAIEEALGGSERVMRVMAKHLTRIGNGELQISKTGKVGAGVRTFLNSANPNDVNYNELIADRTQIVNDSLLLNKGVQTEGDAQRAVAALMASDDQASMVRAMKRLIDLNKQAMNLQQRKRQLIHRNYGQQQPASPAPADDDDALIGKYL